VGPILSPYDYSILPYIYSNNHRVKQVLHHSVDRNPLWISSSGRLSKRIYRESQLLPPPSPVDLSLITLDNATFHYSHTSFDHMPIHGAPVCAYKYSIVGALLFVGLWPPRRSRRGWDVSARTRSELSVHLSLCLCLCLCLSLWRSYSR